jgi:hypothetical protein
MSKGALEDPNEGSISDNACFHSWFGYILGRNGETQFQCRSLPRSNSGPVLCLSVSSFPSRRWTFLLPHHNFLHHLHSTPQVDHIF